MRTFFRENTPLAGKMLGYQLVLMIFSVIVSAAVGTHKALFLIVSIFCILFYLYLLYIMSWELGAKDKVRIEGGRMKASPWKGVLISLLANVFNLLLAALALIGKLGMQFADNLSFWERLSANPVTAEQLASDITYPAARLLAETSPNWAYSLCGVCDSILHFLQIMYAGILNVVSPYNPLFYFVCIATAVATCGVSYLLGTKNLRILPAKSTQNQ